MNNRPIITLAALVFLAAIPGAARAQEARASDAPVAAPSQNGAPASARQQAKPDSANSSAQPGAKKVWTNDDVNGLKGDSAISTFSPAEAKTSKAAPAKVTPVRKDASWYKAQIAKLEAKIPPLNDQIAQLQAAIDGQPPGDGKKSTRPTRVKGGQFSDELGELQQRRGSIQKQIEGLRDEARRNGVAANALP